jgi:putative phosphonate metabolism protein
MPEIMPNRSRFAIYYVPPRDAALYQFGAAWLGYDGYSGAPLPPPDGDVADWRTITEEPRVYGFHATLKPPFALAEGATVDHLIDTCRVFAAKPRAIPVIMPKIDAVGSFLAVVPEVASAELQQLAADCVRDFDGLRAPLTESDRARRKPQALTAQQRDYLERWGYPYVMDDFRFHMTLTGRLSEPRRAALLAQLRQRFAELALDHCAIDRIVLCQQQDRAPFRVIGEFPLRSA